MNNDISISWPLHIPASTVAAELRRVADQLDPEPEDGRLGDADDLVGWVSELDTELHSAQALTDARIEDVRDEFSERLDAIKEQLDDLSRRHSRTSQRLTRFGEHLDIRNEADQPLDHADPTPSPAEERALNAWEADL